MILPVCHGGEFLGRALASLAGLTVPQGGFEAIIAGEKETINNVASENATAGWRFLACDGNRSQVLNAACAEAQGTVWVFSDDDCVFPSGWLLNIERALADFPESSVLGGSDVLTREGDHFDQALDVVLNSWMGNGGTRADRTIKAGRYYPKLWNMIISADAAKRAPTDSGCIFDPSLPVHEDVDLIDRIEAQNGKVVYVPSVRVEHSRDTNFKAFFTRNMDMAAVCRQADIHRMSHLAMAIFFVGVVLLGITSFFSPQISPGFLWVAGVYALAAVLTGIHGAWKKKKFAILGIVPVLLFSLHLARVLGYVFAPFPQKKVIL